MKEKWLIIMIGDTYFTDTQKFNLLHLGKRDTPYKRKEPKKQPFHRFNLSIPKKSYALNLNAICRKLPDINQTYINS